MEINDNYNRYIEKWVLSRGSTNEYEICAALMVHFDLQKESAIQIYNLWRQTNEI